MPLLDTNVDWTVFKNWPDEITVKGKACKMSITGIHDDYAFGIASRAEANPQNHILVMYDGRGPTCSWAQNRVIECGVRSARPVSDGGWGVDVAVFSFHGNGNLAIFAYDDKNSGWWRRAYYDLRGKLLGYEEEKTWPRDEWPFPSRNVWNGKPIWSGHFGPLVQSNWANMRVENPTTSPDKPTARDTGGSSTSPPRRRR